MLYTDTVAMGSTVERALHGHGDRGQWSPACPRDPRDPRSPRISSLPFKQGLVPFQWRVVCALGERVLL